MAATKQQKLFTEELSKVEIVRVEKNLNTIGFFTPSSKKLTGVSSKTVTIQVRSNNGQKVDARATIFPSAEFGLPTTADQDKYFAFQKLVERLRGPDGLISNPVRFTSASLLDVLGVTHGGKNYADISDWLRRMTFTGIESEGVVFLAGKKKYARDMFHVFQRSIAVGEVLEDGTVAQENYVWLSEWQLDNLNNRHTLPINFDCYRMLQLHIGKALVPLLQLWFFASRDQYTEKRYRQVCSLLGIQQYHAISRIRQQIGPSLDELVKTEFLSNWEIAETADGAEYKLRMWAGSAFVSSSDLRMAAQARPLLLPDRSEIVTALVERGVREDKARNLLLNLPADQLVMDQIEWADTEMKRKAKTSSAIQNPAGFLVYVLQSNHPVPASFVSSRRRKLVEQASAQAEKERAAAAQRELETYAWKERYESYVASHTDEYIASNMPGDVWKRRLAAMRRTVMQNNAMAKGWPQQVIDEYATRLLREDLARDLGLLSLEEFREQEQPSLL
jgi:Replication initiator protein A